METYSRRQYLICCAILAGAHWPEAVEAVSSTAIEHPEWDMEEKKTWDQWKGMS